ncbi:MAG: type II secretion system protein N, partial [Pseudomonadales bacterium]|nr:type II secretion system protein N [Pseudomonadales bacterium]
PPSRLAWRLAPAGLLAGELRLMLDLAGAGHQLQARTSLTPAQLVVHNLAGEVQASYLQPLATPYGLGLSGALEIRNIALTSAGNWLASAAGDLQWTGGRLEFPTPLGPQQIYLPAMQGNISLQGDNLALEVLTQAVAGGEPILTILVKPTGWVEVAIKARLFKLAQLPWPATAGLDATALTVEEKLF